MERDQIGEWETEEVMSFSTVDTRTTLPLFLIVIASGKRENFCEGRN